MSQSIQPSTPRRWERIIVIGLISVGLLLALFFGFRAFRSFMQIRQYGLKPGVTDVEAIRGWMTVPYIAKAYKVPPEYLFEKIGVPPAGNQHKSLSQLNRERNLEKMALLNAVKEAIRQYQAEHPPFPEAPHER
jgi:hypothetical protein